MVFPSNGLQGQTIITQQTKTRVNNKAVGNMFSQKNRGTKVSIQSAPATAGVVVIQIPNFSSASATTPFTVIDSNNVSYSIIQMVQFYPGSTVYPASTYYVPSDVNGNTFYFPNNDTTDTFNTGTRPSTINVGSTTYTIGASFLVANGQAVSYYLKN
jgi:hypothetical protein